ncbi:MAG: hypothetical protein IJN57_11370, partial [Oscillospiraceae bacterium]|nr:hypothetical protein [Oscillospiraceae bacterium]
MKKEQIVDMIGEAPDNYVKDAKEYKKKRRIPRWSKWMGGIAAVLAIVLLVNNMPGIPLAIHAYAVSKASEPRVSDYDAVRNKSQEEKDAWWAANDLRDDLRDEALPSLASFSELCSAEMISGTDSTNRVWSPVNAYIALAMTAELTEGEAQEELFALLGVDSLEALRSRISAVWESAYENDKGNEICTLANSLWIDSDLDYAKEAMDTLAYDYYASVYQRDLGSDRTNTDITNWMKNQTGGFLSDRTGKTDLAKDDMMLTMASTIYFQAKWGDEFNKGMNTDGVFHAAYGDVNCTFMNQKLAEMNYYWAEDYGAVAMRMKNGATMWFILPDEDKAVDDVLSGGDYMNMVTLSDAFPEENKKWMKVNLSVPKFDVSSSVNVKEGLQNLGVSKIFDWTTNSFASTMQSKSKPYPVYLDSINQDTRVKIDEKGVTAASYIELNFGAGAAEPPDEIIDFVLDRPFVFVVSREQIPLFVG